MEDKEASRTIRTGFTDRFMVSHTSWEFTKKCFLMDESLYEGHLAWFLLIHILYFNEYISMFGILLKIFFFKTGSFVNISTHSSSPPNITKCIMGLYIYYNNNHR